MDENAELPRLSIKKGCFHGQDQQITPVIHEKGCFYGRGFGLFVIFA